jgi:hypothetical protein
MVLVRFVLIPVWALWAWCHAAGQVNVVTMGIELKPLFSSSIVGAGAVEVQSGVIRSRVEPSSGLNFGMVVRRGLSKSWSLETGICWVRRNFHLKTFNGELSSPLETQFRLICYEIPMQALVFVKLGEKLFMNGSGGVSLDVYPSDVESFASDNMDSIFFDLQHRTFRRKWLQAAMLVNYGFEYRTTRSGYFYLGASYHRGFQDIATSVVRHTRNSDPDLLYIPMSGNYLTLDFRYFFHEKPVIKPKRT